MARLSAEEMFKNMIGRKDEEPQPAQETAAAPTAEKKKASTVQVTVRLRYVRAGTAGARSVFCVTYGNIKVKKSQSYSFVTF